MSNDHKSVNDSGHAAGETAKQAPAPEFDMGLIEHNLRLTPEERLIEHQRALDLANELEQAGRRFYAENK